MNAEDIAKQYGATYQTPNVMASKYGASYTPPGQMMPVTKKLPEFSDLGIGAGKSLVSSGRGLAGMVQGLGKKALGLFGADTSKMGIQSISNDNPIGQQVSQQLQPTNQTQKVGGLLETAGEFGLGGVTKEGAQGATKVKQGYDAYKEARGATLAEEELGKVTDLVRPKLTPTMEAEAKAAGRGTTEGDILNRTKINPTKAETEMGQFAHEAGVNHSNAFDKNIQLMKEAQTKAAGEIRSGLKNAKGTWNRNDVVGTLNKLEKPITIKSDATLAKTAQNFQKAIVSLSEKAPKNPEGLLDLRLSVDKLIEKEFPANIYHKDTPIGQFVRSVRQALNGMAESKLPEGKLPNGATIREEWRRQHLLYDAIENVAEKAPKEGESARPILQKARALAKKHPVITGGAGALVGEKILKKVGIPLP